MTPPLVRTNQSPPRFSIRKTRPAPGIKSPGATSCGPLRLSTTAMPSRTFSTLKSRSKGPGLSDLAVSFGAEGSALAISDDCFGAAGGRGLAELAPATATLFSNLSSLATTSADSEAGVAGKATFFSSLSSLAAISANLEEEILVDALAELIQTCSVLVLDLVEPDRQLCERGAEVAGRGPLLLARALAPDRL